MIFSYKPFRISLRAFKDFLDEHCPNSDGIVANADNFIVVEKQPFTQAEIEAVQAYYDGMTEAEEEIKRNRKPILAAALEKYNNYLLTKPVGELTGLNKKVLVGSALTKVEENEIINWAGSYTEPATNDISYIIDQKLAKNAANSSALLRNVYRQNTLSGITTQQSLDMFRQYADVLLIIREGAFPTAILALQQAVPEGFVTQQLINDWIATIQSYSA